MKSLRLVSPVALVGVAMACGSDERLDTGSAAAPPGTSQDAGQSDVAPPPPPPDSGSADSGKPKRAVFSRNPFGNVRAKDNMLWDGDFEWHSPFARQYGWAFVGTFFNQAGFDQVRVGAECKSGMKCGFITQNQRLTAIGVSPTDAMVSASVWVKIPTDLCFDVTVQLFACDYGGDPDVNLVPEQDSPDDNGWCHFTTIADPRQRATCLFLEASFGEGEAIVDDAVVEPVPPGARVVRREAPPVSSAQARVLDEARADLRRYLKPGRPAPNPARRELEAWLRRPR